MRHLLTRPFVQALLVAVLACGMVFPHLGTPGLWDDDEGVNAECAREMMEADNWIVPTFNWDLRTAKPIFLYWLLRFSYIVFGVSEFAARLPSAIAFVLTAILVYDLGRKMFDRSVGFLAAIIAMSSLELVKLGRGCTTDSVLIAFTTLYFWALHRGSVRGGRGWFLPCAAASAFATLTKGPAVGLLLILGIVGTWFFWNRDLRRLWDRRMFWACLVWGVIAIPWYAFVATESHGEWPKAFFLKENLERSAEASEGHSGLPFYYLIVVCLMFAPWSAFLAVTVWQTVRNCRRSKLPSPLAGDGPTLLGTTVTEEVSLRQGNAIPPPAGLASLDTAASPQRGEAKSAAGLPPGDSTITPASPRWGEAAALRGGREEKSFLTKAIKSVSGCQPLAAEGNQTISDHFREYRLLSLWVLVYLAAFSVAATKLPHYIAPAYPPLAILAAVAIVRWMRAEAAWPWWGIPGPALGLFGTGLIIGVGLLLSGTGHRLGRHFPGLESWAWLGLIPIAGAAAMMLYYRRGNRPAVIVSFAVSAVLFVGLVGTFPPVVLDRYKAAKELVAESGARQLDREVVVASYDYSQPSVTFYAARAVRRVWDAQEINDLLSSPIPAYLFVKAESWENGELTGKITAKYRIAARRYDFYRNREILVVTNRY